MDRNKFICLCLFRIIRFQNAQKTADHQYCTLIFSALFPGLELSANSGCTWDCLASLRFFVFLAVTSETFCGSSPWVARCLEFTVGKSSCPAVTSSSGISVLSTLLGWMDFLAFFVFFFFLLPRAPSSAPDCLGWAFEGLLVNFISSGPTKASSGWISACCMACFAFFCFFFLGFSSGEIASLSATSSAHQHLLSYSLMRFHISMQDNLTGFTSLLCRNHWLHW